MKFLLAIAAASAALTGAAAAQNAAPDAAAIHDRVLTMDTHVDTPDNFVSAEHDPGGFTDLQVDLPKMRAGGLDAAFFIVYTGQGDLTDEGYAAAHQNAETEYANIIRMVRAYPGQVALATTADEVEAIAATGKRVALIGMENAYPLGLSVDEIPMWRARGVSYVSLTHFGNNQFGGSSNPNEEKGEEPAHITGLGLALVAALNDNGIMVDVSHVGKLTMMDALEASRAPIIASHSGVKAVNDNARNLDDEQLRAIAENGGVAQMVALDSYVKNRPEEKTAARDAILAELGLDTPEGREAATAEDKDEARARLEALNEEWPGATVSDYVDHIDHAVEVAGIDHVGIASDFDGGGGIDGWRDASETANVTAELVKRGYSEDEIAKIWGGNLLRVMRAVQAEAAT